MCSVVFPATTADGVPAILKLTVPHDDVVGEVVALRRWEGAGTARVLRASGDGFTLLLERCIPGHDLWTLPVDGQIEILSQLLPKLWIDPGPDLPIRELTATVARWERRMRDEPDHLDAPADVVADAAEWANELRTTPAARVLLHGDLNPGNVLAAERAPWLAIDPKPWLGDPAIGWGDGYDEARTLHAAAEAAARG